MNRQINTYNITSTDEWNIFFCWNTKGNKKYYRFKLFDYLNLQYFLAWFIQVYMYLAPFLPKTSVWPNIEARGRAGERWPDWTSVTHQTLKLICKICSITVFSLPVIPATKKNLNKIKAKDWKIDTCDHDEIKLQKKTVSPSLKVQPFPTSSQCFSIMNECSVSRTCLQREY